MKAMCNREGLLAAFGLVSAVAPTRTPKEILRNLKLVASEDGSTLMGSDLELGVRSRVLGIKVDAPGEAILPTASVGQVLRASADEELLVESDGDTLSVRGVRSEWDLGTDDPALFPDVPDFDAADYHVVDAGELKSAIARTVFATDAGSTRYALGGILLEFGEDAMSLVATDGRRLAKQTLVAGAEGEPEPPSGAVVPIKAMKLLFRHLDASDPPVHIAFQKSGTTTSAVLIRTETAVFYSRLLEGRFPRYQDAFPPSCEAKVALEAGPLRSVVDQASIVATEESRGIDLEFGGGTLRLAAQGAESGRSRAELPVAYDGKPITVTFDHRYVQDPLKVLDGDARLVLELVDAKNAAVMKTEDGLYSYVLMPLARERG